MIARTALIALAALTGAVPAIAFDSAPSGFEGPPQFSLVETYAPVMGGMTEKIYRDGDRAMVESIVPKQVNGAVPAHILSYYNWKTGRIYTLDLNNPQTPCGMSERAGLAWSYGWPFEGSERRKTELAQQAPADRHEEIVNGVKTRVLVKKTKEGLAEFWIEPSSGLIIREEVSERNNKPHTIVEVTQFSFGPPPVAMLTPPPTCGAHSDATQSLHLTSVPGSASNATVPPASSQSCTALLRVVPAGKMTPLTHGYQVAIDRDIDLAHPASYRVDLAADGRADFAGGGLREETASVHDGTLRIDAIPRQIHIELCFGKGGCASALIYRQCTAPETVLLYAVNNPTRISDGGAWWWVKAPRN